eukprot:1161664-Pelagomonas_calceolata.AAC.10
MELQVIAIQCLQMVAIQNPASLHPSSLQTALLATGHYRCNSPLRSQSYPRPSLNGLISSIFDFQAFEGAERVISALGYPNNVTALELKQQRLAQATASLYKHVVSK